MGNGRIKANEFGFTQNLQRTQSFSFILNDKKTKTLCPL